MVLTLGLSWGVWGGHSLARQRMVPHYLGASPQNILPLGGTDKSFLPLQPIQKLIDRLFSLDKLVCGGATTRDRLDSDAAI